MDNESFNLDIYGPEYPKINSIFERTDKGIIVPDKYSTPEIAYLANSPWLWWEKVDGTNIRLYWNGKFVTIGGRTNGDSQLNAILVHHIMHESSLMDSETWRSVFKDCDDVTIYGEGYGKGIRSGGQYSSAQHFIAFDVRVGQWWLSPENIADVSRKFGIDSVPHPWFAIKDGEYTSLDKPISLVEAWNILILGGLKSCWANAKIEGLVGRPAVDLYNRKGERVIAKMKVRDWEDFERAQKTESARKAKEAAKSQPRTQSHEDAD